MRDANFIYGGQGDVILVYKSRPKRLEAILGDLPEVGDAWHYWSAEGAKGEWLDLHLSPPEPTDEPPVSDEAIRGMLLNGLREMAE